MSVYETLVEDKMRRFKGECAQFSFSKCHTYTHDGASANFGTNSHEADFGLKEWQVLSAVMQNMVVVACKFAPLAKLKGFMHKSQVFVVFLSTADSYRCAVYHWLTSIAKCMPCWNFRTIYWD